MSQTTIEGAGAQRKDLSAWFTPHDLAERIVTWALEPFVVPDPIDVLEPSAGRGALVKPLLRRGCDVTAIDIDPDNVSTLEALGCKVLVGDFLEMHAVGPFALAIMNPPFEGGAAEAHIMHALTRADRVVAHVPLTTLEGKARRESLWSRVELHRLAICSSRPRYGAKGGATAMCTIDVTLASDARRHHWAHDVRMEFWP
jgi:predicted RNA methylase